MGQDSMSMGKIMAYCHRTAMTNYEIAWVTVALQHLRAGDDS